MPKRRRLSSRQNHTWHVPVSLSLSVITLAVALIAGREAVVVAASQGVPRYALSRGGATVDRHGTVGFAQGTALEQRENIMKRTVSVTVLLEGSKESLPPVTLVLRQYPSWSKMEEKYGETRAVLNAERIAQELPTALKLPAPVDCELTSVAVDEHGVRRASTDCAHAAPGYEVSVESFIDLLSQAIVRDATDITITATRREGTIRNASGEALGPLEFLSSGLSDFAGSGEGRKSNVRKALKDRINNVVIGPHETASFNAMIGDLSTRDGWKMALGIFGGTTLRPTLGGGICQASTTVYRAVLSAGLPLGKRKNHSLFVSYYEKHGVGQDVTVFMGAQDFTFVNDTSHAILLQAYDEGTEARVVMYGVNDGRSVAMEGPFFKKNAPKDMVYNGRALKANEIAWNRIIRRADGSEEKELLVSRYNALPRSLPDRWIVAAANSHAAAADAVRQP